MGDQQLRLLRRARSPACGRRAWRARPGRGSTRALASRSLNSALHHFGMLLPAGLPSGQPSRKKKLSGSPLSPVQPIWPVSSSAFCSALAIFAPFEGDELGVDADLGEVGLHHLADALAVRVVGALHRLIPEVDVERRLDAGRGEHRLGLLGIVGIVGDLVVIGPHRRAGSASWPSRRRRDRRP